MKNALTTFDAEVAQAVSRFSTYTDATQSNALGRWQRREQNLNEEIVQAILNGETALALQRLVPLEVRKKAGLFFTSTTLADRIADRLAPMLAQGSRLLDPACGAGNLLLACSRHFPMGRNLDETLTIWAELVLGYDFYVDFIRAAQLRLVLLALSLHPEEIGALTALRPHHIFKGLEAGNAFAQKDTKQNTCIAINPPFGHIEAPTEVKWASGKIQVAAWFLEKLLRRTGDGQHVVAILPDVLRSGSRYSDWRNIIASLCSSIDLELAGRFDKNTDVDVFIMHVVRGNQNLPECQWQTSPPMVNRRENKVSDFFDVRVGPVVPHRDPLLGPRQPYIHTRTAPAWQTINVISEERQFAGTVFSPPFLAIRRTSSPRDKHRCVATIVNEKREVAVENHLLVARPHDGSLQSCEQLLEVMKSPQTDNWLNNRIRCRHLTVSAIRELPCCAIRPNKLQQ